MEDQILLGLARPRFVYTSYLYCIIFGFFHAILESNESKSCELISVRTFSVLLLGPGCTFAVLLRGTVCTVLTVLRDTEYLLVLDSENNI